MPYTPTAWADGPAGGTPITAANLNHVETGLQTADTTASAAIPKPAAPGTGDALVYNGTSWDKSSGTTKISAASLAPGSSGQSLVTSGGVPAWSTLLPAGMVVPFAGTAAPSGWVLCDGSTVDGTTATFAALWTAIGLTYGGTGQAAFKVPDLQGRAPIGKSAAGGHADVTTLGNNDALALANRRPKHRHTIALGFSDTGHTHLLNGSVAGAVQVANIGSAASFNQAPSASATTGITFNPTVGASTSDNLDAQPYLVLLYIIKL